MKFVFFLCLILVLALHSCHEPLINELQSTVDSIGVVWVPDRRLGVDNVKVLTNGSGFLLKGEVNQRGHKSALLEFFNQKNISITDSLRVLPDSTGDSHGIIRISVANMRSEPRHWAEMVSQALMGTPVLILKDDDGWLQIQTPDGYIAWMTDESVTICSDVQMASWRSSQRVIVEAQHSYVYIDEQESGIVCDLVLGCLLEVASSAVAHYCVELPDGRRGFVRMSHVTLFNEWLLKRVPTEEGLVACARSFMGLPYLWGGTSANGLDCSGFVKTVYFMNGVVLMRDASQQFLQGDALECNDMDGFKAGDLLFFGNTETRRVTHVGMWLGNGCFIHESGLVGVNSLDRTHTNYSRYYNRALLGARRIIGALAGKEAIAVGNHQWYVNLQK